MNMILFDEASLRQQLLPLTFTRPIADLRVGILTLAEKWKYHFKQDYSFLTETYLSQKFTTQFGDDNLFINGALCPNESLAKAIQNLGKEQSLVSGTTLLAVRTQAKEVHQSKNVMAFDEAFTLIDQPWKIFIHNAAEIKNDFKLITEGRKSQPITDKHTLSLIHI